jgi:NAD+ synthase
MLSGLSPEEPIEVRPKNFGRDRRNPIVNRFRDPGLNAQKPDVSIAPRKSVGTSGSRSRAG